MTNYFDVKDTIFNSKKTLNCQGNLVLIDKPFIMGIVNATPDSFYSRSRNRQLDSAIQQVKKHLNEGADLIDLGGYSSRPGADDVSESEEINRLIPLIQEINTQFPGTIISIDTFRPKVAEACLKAGTHIINDITGGQFDESIYEVAANYQAPYILMHMRGTPKTMQQQTEYSDLIPDLIYYFSEKFEKALKAGVKDLILDPGLGFSKTLEQNYQIVKNLPQFSPMGAPVLIGASRKSMLYKLLDSSPEESLNATTVINTLALNNGADFLRVHDVKEAVECRKIIEKIQTV